MKHQVYWKNDAKKDFPALAQDTTCSVLIVGGGISGVVSAYLLAKAGITDIVLVEQSKIGSGATGHSAGMLVTEIEGESLHGLIELLGERLAKEYWQAQAKALHLVKQIVTSENIECDLEHERLFVFGKGQKNTEQVKQDITDRKRERLLSRSFVGESLARLVTAEFYDIGEEVHGGISVNPLKLVQGIAEAAERNGVVIYEDTKILNFDLDSKIAYTTSGSIRYNTAIVAKDAYFDSSEIEIFKTTCAVSEPLEPEVLARMNLLEHQMYIENELSAYHYAKVADHNRLLVGYGDTITDHAIEKVGLSMGHMHNIEKYLQAVFKGIEIPIEYAWSGIYGLHKNPLPYVKFDLAQSYYEFGGAGTQVSAIAIATMLTDSILRNKNPLFEIFKI